MSYAGDMQAAQHQLLQHLPPELHVFERRDGASVFIQGGKKQEMPVPRGP
jgi:hypothetical protein